MGTGMTSWWYRLLDPSRAASSSRYGRGGGSSRPCSGFVTGGPRRPALRTKVCPVQRYGLSAVIDEVRTTGRILGKDTNELKAYGFMGEQYSLGERPDLRPEFFARALLDAP